MTFDPDLLQNFWNYEYFPEVVDIEKVRYPRIDTFKKIISGNCQEILIPVRLDCTDGFQEAFYGRPEAFLDPNIRLAQSAWGFLPEGLEEIIVKRLEKDLKSGEWDKKYHKYRTQPFFTCALKLLIFENFN